MASSKELRVTLTEDIIRQGELAYNPDLPESGRAVEQAKFAELLSTSKTLTLMPVLTTLVQPGRVKPWLRLHLLQELSLIPLRLRGVRSTIEFILSVHPSNVQNSSSSGSSTPQSRGANISLEALNVVSRLISSPPQALSPEKWFSGIAPQLFLLLDGECGLEMVKVAAYIIGYGILGRRELGAPGKPGWKAFAEPILSHIDPTLSFNIPPAYGSKGNPDITVLPVRPHNLIVSASGVAEALRRLASLLTSHPNPSLSKRLLERLLLPLWSISSRPPGNVDELGENYRAPARFLLQILLQLSADGSHLRTIAKNLLYLGNRDSSRLCWTYKPSSGLGLQIEKFLGSDENLMFGEGLDMAFLDERVDAFVELLRPLKESNFVPELFLSLSKRWLLTTNEPAQLGILKSSPDESNIEDSIVNARVMQRMMDEFPNRLIGDSMQVLELSDEVLQKTVRSGEDLNSDDTVAVTLSLLNVVFTSTSFSSVSKDQPAYKSVRSSLEDISRRTQFDVSLTARNLLFLLDFQAADTTSSRSAPPKLDKDFEDRKTYNLGLSYLRSTDSPPPVRAQGLDLISGLITSNGTILDIPAILILFLSLLQDDDEYIYLKVIKCFILLSVKHPKAVMQNLIERYVDTQEEASLDARLRLGEALLQVIQKAGEAFTGDPARQVGEALLSVAGRREHRLKGESVKQKRAAASKRRNQEAEEAWDGPVPQLEETTMEDEILGKIVEGWEGTRGEEDVRMRASALSLFGSAIETNVAGMGAATLSNAVDLAINVLALESEPEKAILRRSAILLVMSLTRALDDAQAAGRKLGFGLAGQSLDDVLRILRFVAELDNDDLVRQHARDVLDALRTWQLKSLARARDLAHPELQHLAGLSVNLGSSSPGVRGPRIEEIE